MYIIIAILLFGILIAAHEWGHFIAARLCGVTVNEFSLGMGPVLWKKMGKKGTQFSIRALPIGGFCARRGRKRSPTTLTASPTRAFGRRSWFSPPGPS